jgi:hypothetical protein
MIPIVKDTAEQRLHWIDAVPPTVICRKWKKNIP